MKKVISLILSVVLIGAFCVFALGSGESDEKEDQGKDSATASDSSESNLGDYELQIDSCRLAEDYSGKKVVIVKYIFTNNGDESQSFMVAFDDKVYQNGVGLNPAYILSDSANYSSDNQTKSIQKGASLEVEVAYELNDTTTDITVEVEELISFNDKKITKTFTIA